MSFLDLFWAGTECERFDTIRFLHLLHDLDERIEFHSKAVLYWSRQRAMRQRSDTAIGVPQKIMRTETSNTANAHNRNHNDCSGCDEGVKATGITTMKSKMGSKGKQVKRSRSCSESCAESTAGGSAQLTDIQLSKSPIFSACDVNANYLRHRSRVLRHSAERHCVAAELVNHCHVMKTSLTFRINELNEFVKNNQMDHKE